MTRRNTTKTLSTLFVGAGLLAVLVFTSSSGTAQADHLHDYPLQITYEIQYQQEVDLKVPLAKAQAVWTVRSPSDWDFEFNSGPDKGTVYSLRPDGTFTSTDGRTVSETTHRPGTEMVPLPDMAFDNYAKAAMGYQALSGAESVETAGSRAADARQSAAAKSALPESQLKAVVVTRESDSDAFEYDQVTGTWVGAHGSVTETVVVDAESQGVVFREIVFEGQLVRRVEVVAVVVLR